MSTFTISVPLPASRIRWAAAGLAAGLLVALMAAPSLAPRPLLATDATGQPAEHTIAVTGTGRVLIAPDLADVRLGVAITKPTVKAARQASAEVMTKVIARLKALGISDADIQTTILSLQPIYSYPSGGSPRVTGYQLSNAIAVTVRDIDKAGDAIDAGLAAGATTLDGVSFRVDDQAKAEAKAREAAMSEAKAKAETLARGAGVSLGGVASISEVSAPVPYPIYGAYPRVAADKATQTPVEPGTNEITVTVSVSYLIR